MGGIWAVEAAPEPSGVVGVREGDRVGPVFEEVEAAEGSSWGGGGYW